MRNALLAITTAVLVLAGSLPGIPAAAAPTAAGPARCSLAPGAHLRTLTHQVPRSYRLHVPEKVTAGAGRPPGRLPLVLAFHGRGSSAEELQGYSDLDQLDAIIAYPDGLLGEGRQSWQGAPYQTSSDDLGFTGALIDAMIATGCVDPDRVHATGKSNGGGFAALLACRLGHRLASVAVVAGAYYPGTQEGCATAAPLPILELHGTADATMRYEGGISHGSPYLAVPAWLDTWVRRNRCHRPSERRIGSDVTELHWQGCRQRNEVLHYRIDGGGHTWPGATRYSGGGAVTSTIRAHQVMGEFFDRHSRIPD